jgi:hypothetical protein
MKNKENALRKIEQIEGTINNTKSSAFRGNGQEMTENFQRLQELVEELKGLISIEREEFLNRPYQGL